jgi:ribonuclease E
MLESEPNETKFNDNTAGGGGAGELNPSSPAVPAAVFQPPQVVFQPPAARPEPAAPSPASESARPARAPGASDPDGDADNDDDGGASGRRRRRRPSRSRAKGGEQDAPAAAGDADDGADAAQEAPAQPESQRAPRTRSRRSGPAKDSAAAPAGQRAAESQGTAELAEPPGPEDAAEEAEAPGTSGRRRRRKRRRGSAESPAGSEAPSSDDPPDTVVHVREPGGTAGQAGPDDVRSVKGSTRLEAKKQRRREGRDTGRRRPPIITESEFLARRESVERTMVVRQRKDRTQIAVLEDGVLVEHYVNRSSQQSYVGNVYLGKVQKVLHSMEAGFVHLG